MRSVHFLVLSFLIPSCLLLIKFQIALKTCTSAAIFVSRDEQNGSSQASVAPYTIIAYPDQGVPTVDLLGNDINAMTWTPRFPAGASTCHPSPSPFHAPLFSYAGSTPKLTPVHRHKGAHKCC